jgi:CBS domain-containing protein
MKEKDIMNTDVITVEPSDTVGKALQIMKDKKVNGTPVVNDRNILLGIVVKADIYRFLIQPGHYEDCPIEWVMTKEVVRAYPDEGIIEAAKRLRSNNVIALPVVEGDYLVGIVSIEDIVDYFIWE